MRASFADIAGVQTRFFQHGEGDYGVVLIHGVGVGADSWLWNLEALGQGRTAVGPDLLGYGLMSMEALMHYDVTSRLHEIAAPTLVIWGRQDIRGELKEAERHAARLPRGKMLVWEECGHLPYLEKPAPFNAVVDAFIREV
jgi:pimeloyl-ACP methyl ester carboxylesterase